MRHAQLRVQRWRQGLCPSDERTNYSFMTPVDLNLEQTMSMLMFHPD